MYRSGRLAAGRAWQSPPRFRVKARDKARIRVRDKVKARGRARAKDRIKGLVRAEHLPGREERRQAKGRVRDKARG
jgi:hypothetical protein